MIKQRFLETINSDELPLLRSMEAAKPRHGKVMNIKITLKEDTGPLKF